MNRGAGYCWRARRVSVYHRRLEGASRRNQQQCLAVLGLMLDDLQASSLCRVPCDYIPKRSYPLFRTRQILNDWLTQNLEEA